MLSAEIKQKGEMLMPWSYWPSRIKNRKNPKQRNKQAGAETP